MTLFINCCPRKESRTKVLSDAVLAKLGSYTEVNLYETDLAPLDEEALAKRTALVQARRFDDESFAPARAFAAADRIVIAAPFWDGSFPSKLKIYLENIYVIGIVSRYGENGAPIGLCRAQSLVYVTTAGGAFDGRFGYEYVKALCLTCFGIPNVSLVKAEMLDVVGNDAEKILAEAIRGVSEREE